MIATVPPIVRTTARQASRVVGLSSTRNTSGKPTIHAAAVIISQRLFCTLRSGVLRLLATQQEADRSSEHDTGQSRGRADPQTTVHTGRLRDRVTNWWAIPPAGLTRCRTMADTARRSAAVLPRTMTPELGSEAQGPATLASNHLQSRPERVERC
jgi:hypothetical protein